MKLSKTLLTIALTTAVAFTASAHGDKQDKSPEGQAAKYRHNVFGMIGYHFGPMGDMIKGKSDYDKDTFSKNADALASLAVLAANGFEVEGVAKGSRAKKKIWDKYEDFQARQQALIDHAEQLLAATDTGDKKQLKSAFKTLSKDCKGCHMRYRQVF